MDTKHASPGWFDGPTPSVKRRRPFADLLAEIAERDGSPILEAGPAHRPKDGEA